MPTKYSDRLKIPYQGIKEINFYTLNGLEIARGYERILLTNKVPIIEFTESMIRHDNIVIPNSQVWRINQKSSPFVEYRSKDFCSVKIMKWKESKNDLNENMFYVSVFDLKSDKFPILIEKLYRRKTLQA